MGKYHVPDFSRAPDQHDREAAREQIKRVCYLAFRDGRKEFSDYERREIRGYASGGTGYTNGTLSQKEVDGIINHMKTCADIGR